MECSCKPPSSASSPLWHFSLQSDKLISRTKLFASRVDGRTEATSAPTPASGAECPPSLKRGRRGKTGRKEEQKSQGEIMSIVYKAGEYAGRGCCTRSTTFILYSDERNCPSTCYVSVFCSVSNRIGTEHACLRTAANPAKTDKSSIKKSLASL